MELIILIVVIAMIGMRLNMMSSPIKKTEPCKIHKWERKTDSAGQNPYLQCSVCNKIPSIVIEEN
jgi:hypothetical protein